jgi:hypothetical protein
MYKCVYVLIGKLELVTCYMLTRIIFGVWTVVEASKGFLLVRVT